MTGSYDIMIVGIGGQGTILASNILGEACLIEGRSVRGAETHGMAQRGGSVESHVRIDGIFGPLIAPGTADLLIGFDLLEGLRYSHFLKPEGKMVLSRRMVIPTSVFVQGLTIPSAEDIIRKLSRVRSLSDRCRRDCTGSGKCSRSQCRHAWCSIAPYSPCGRIPGFCGAESRPAKNGRSKYQGVCHGKKSRNEMLKPGMGV